MKYGLYELSVLVPSSKGHTPVREFGHNGLTYVEGRKQQPYTIKFRNLSASRVLAIVSVDGLDVVDGKPASSESRGYIVPAYQSVEIKGWRTDLDKVNEFVFSPKEAGYSTQTQDTDINCGVVAVKVIAEKPEPTILRSLLPRYVKEEHHHHHHYPPIKIEPLPWIPNRPTIWCSTATSGITKTSGPESVYSVAGGVAPAAETIKMCAVNYVQEAACLAPQTQPNPDFNLGTGWGAEVKDEITLRDFKRGEELATFSLFYTDAEGLLKVGIDTSKTPAVSKPLPQGFGGFCKPPKVTS